MRRTVISHLHTSDTWISRIKTNSDVSPDIAQGLNAYARRQAQVWSNLAVDCVRKWSPDLLKHGLTVQWPARLQRYSSMTTTNHTTSGSTDILLSRNADVDRSPLDSFGNMEDERHVSDGGEDDEIVNEKGQYAVGELEDRLICTDDEDWDDGAI